MTNNLANVPRHIARFTSKKKLERQLPFFEPPAWCDLPSTNDVHLTYWKAGETIGTYQLNREAFFILGRNPEVCDIRMDHPSISSVHCVLVFHKEKQRFFLVDFNSTNGTYVIDASGKIERLSAKKPVELAEGASIRLGFSTRVIVLGYGKASPPPPVPHVVKREREEMEAASKRDRLHAPESLSNSGVHSTFKSVQSKEEISKEAKIKDIVEAAAPSAELDNPPQNSEEKPAAETGSGPSELHLRHILIKHLSSDGTPVYSKGKATKGEIIVRSEAEAVELASRIRVQILGGRQLCSDEEFATCAAQNSECGTSKKGGDLGTVQRGEFDDSFDNAAFALVPGAVSKPVKTLLGVHLIYCSPQ